MGIPGKMYMIENSSREWSYTFFDDLVVKYFATHHPSKETSILDIGAGGGKYKRLLQEYKNMDAVEAWEPYVRDLKLNDLYRNVFTTDILDFDFEFYDVIIMGDILEHIDANKAIGLMKRLMQKCHDMVLVLPYMNVLDVALEGNPYEIHRQPDLTDEVIRERYPMLKRVEHNDISGMYVFDPALRRNYLVHTLYDSGNPEKNALYRKMKDISFKTFSEQIKEPFFYKILEEPYNRDMASSFYYSFKKFYDLWKQNANIFYVDTDTLCVKPLDIFSRGINQFSAFWTSDPPYTEEFPKYMNTGVKYFPATMPKSVWDYGMEIMKDFFENKSDITEWAHDQKMYIRMLDFQGVPYEKFMDNKLNWIYLPSLNSNGLNDIERKDAEIIHFHSTRDPIETVHLMEEYDRGSLTFN